MLKEFLRAEWKNLLMINYEIDPKILKPYLPYKTELDLWNNTAHVSLVGFQFLNTKLLGLSIPFHINFDEVNLRFYVKRKTKNEWRTGVVFIKEIVSKMAISLVANAAYNESYATMPMKSRISQNENLYIEYQWKHKEIWNTMIAHAETCGYPSQVGSFEDFIVEHYWGYSKIDRSKTWEYEVEHPRWYIHSVKKYHLCCDYGALYGNEFSSLATQKPTSVFLAGGSEIIVRKPIKINS